jgi:hypothetical protein
LHQCVSLKAVSIETVFLRARENIRHHHYFEWEANLVRCLNSLKDVVDEVIVVDSGLARPDFRDCGRL